MKGREGGRIGERGRKREERESVGWRERDRKKRRKKEALLLLY